MADTLDLNINIGANVNNLDAAMQKAQNLLGQFQSALKKATSVGEINYLNTQIDNLNTTIKNIGSQMGSVAKPTSDATNALTNLSRVAQDAPYGFVGIANNLNPLLESFQRLQKESGGVGNALKSMASGLMGPAGIGLALGAVSSLFIAFGDDIMNFINQTGELEKAQKSIRDGFADNSKSVEETIVKDKALLSVINDTTQSTEARVSALKKLKEEYKGNIELQKTDITDGKLLEDILRRISNALLRKAEIEAIVKVIGEEYAKQVRLQISSSEEQVKNLSIVTKTWDALKSVVTSGGIGSAVATTYDKLTKTDGLAKSQKDIQDYGNAIAKLQTILDKKTGESYAAGDYKETGKADKPDSNKNTDTETNKRIAEIQKLIKANEDWANSEMKLYEARQKFNKKDGLDIQESGFLNKDTKSLDKTKTKLDNDLPKWAQEDVGISKKLDSDLKKAKKSAEDFANTLSTDITDGLMTMWDAMEKGENPLAALGNYFKDLLKQLAAAVVQAILFQTIMSALGMGGVGTAAGGGGGIIGGIGKIFGFAEGGIVSRPTLSMVGEGGQSEAIMPLNKLGNMMNSTFNAGAMSGAGAGAGNGQFVLKGNDLVLAMQRSNFSLNVRR